MSTLVALAATAAGVWLLVVELWDIGPQWQLVGTNAIIAGVILTVLGLLGLGLRLRRSRSD